MVTGRDGDARGAAAVIAAGYEAYRARFDEITRRAAVRFSRRDWLGAQQDALNRLLLSGHEIDRALEALRRAQGPGDGAFGADLKREYRAWSHARPDADIARTFFNSVVRRAFGILGVESAREFTADELDPAVAGALPVRRHAAVDGNLPLRDILAAAPLCCGVADLETDVPLASALLEQQLDGLPALLHADVLDPIFYRNKGAYIVARLQHEDGSARPLLIALRHHEGVRIDALLASADEVSIVFGFTHSYFHVAIREPRPIVDFLGGIMPHKRVDELYTAIGFHRHGKAELYRALVEHLAADRSRFEPAPGERGLVMAVFTLPSLNVVFKVIRDRFGEPKRTSERVVRERYRLVFTTDRVGRLADAQEFENLELRRSCFHPEVLHELLEACAGTVKLVGDKVVIGRAYTERRVNPLNLYLRETDEPAALAAILDYGRAIKDLAAANIFPGDMLLKNFGVTRQGRVIFYDYDEVMHLTDCVIRRLPEPRSDLEELASEPWFGVADEDVFPEEFGHFMAMPGRLGEAFRDAHGDLFTVEFWREMQERHRRGELVDFFPYAPARRLRRAD
jgi:isocitrate dehydrogenase kinase/phosphatase